MRNKAKEELAAKLLAADPFQPVDVTALGLGLILSGQMNDVMAEGYKREAAKQQNTCGLSPAPDTMYPPVGHIGDPQYRADQKDLNAKLARHNEEQSVKKAYLVEREITFEEIVTPLIKWMAENSCPHSHIVITGTSAELFHGAKSFNTFEFVKD